MKSITKIGKAALQLALCKNPINTKNYTETTRVVFDDHEIDLSIKHDKHMDVAIEKNIVTSTQYSIWSIKLGMVDLDIDESKDLFTLIHGALENRGSSLFSLSKEGPSHIILKTSQTKASDLENHYLGTTENTLTVYRLSQKQEKVIRAKYFTWYFELIEKLS